MIVYFRTRQVVWDWQYSKPAGGPLQGPAGFSLNLTLDHAEPGSDVDVRIRSSAQAFKSMRRYRKHRAEITM